MSALAPAAARAGGPGGSAAPSISGSSSSAAAKSTGGVTPTHGGAVRITAANCVPATHCSTAPHRVSQRGELLIKGASVRRGMVIAFPHSWNARIARNSPTARLSQTSSGLIVRVPASAHSGRIMILLSRGRHSNSYGPIQIVSYALHPPTPRPTSSPATAAPSGTAFDGQGMWIWYVSQSDRGNLASIVAQAKAAQIGTLFVKSSDGSSNYWSQFSPALVATLHAYGLRVCAWQYVYGTNPAGEATLGAKAVEAGADCLVIDAEAEYEGKYGAAQTYIADLRAKIGPSYPLGLASFPYVYYHTSFPYSVFLGPNGAQFNAPQMYWKAIGNSVDTTYANTYVSNRVYGRAIFPLGQTYESPSSADLLRFREEAPLYGAPGISWWDFQETSAAGWKALGAPLTALTSVTPNPGYSELSQGNKGDPVLWMQEHLATAIPAQATTGIFDATTKANLEQFQSAHGIAATGVVEAATWQALLALLPVAVNWTGRGPKG
ncbi:MAG TPA: peptidoglycan-binding domain-containing protein [Solirubrobacteraceae bacterium]|nr:peptidoglycan-binding domain-containing protein [Solirubrobacteraceae bacterium]